MAADSRNGLFPLGRIIQPPTTDTPSPLPQPQSQTPSQPTAGLPAVQLPPWMQSPQQRTLQEAPEDTGEPYPASSTLPSTPTTGTPRTPTAKPSPLSASTDEIAQQNSEIASQLGHAPAKEKEGGIAQAVQKSLARVNKEIADDAHARQLGVDPTHPEKMGKNEADTYASLSALPKLDPSSDDFAKQYDRLGKHDLYQVMRKDDNGDLVPTGIWRRKTAESAADAGKDPDVTSGFGVGKVLNAAGNSLAADADSLKANILRAAGYDREARQAATTAEERSNAGAHQSAIGSFLGQAAPIVASQVAGLAAAPETGGASEAGAVAADASILGRLIAAARGVAAPAGRALSSAPGMGAIAGAQSANRTAAQDTMLGRDAARTARDALVDGGVDAAINSIAPELGGRLYASLRPAARGGLAEAANIVKETANQSIIDRLGGRVVKQEGPQAVRSVEEEAARTADAAASDGSITSAERQKIYDNARRDIIRQRGAQVLDALQKSGRDDITSAFADPAMQAAEDATPFRAGRLGNAVGTGAVFGAGSAVGDEIKHLNDPENHAAPTVSSIALQAGLGGLLGALHRSGLTADEQAAIRQRVEESMRNRAPGEVERAVYDPEGAARQQTEQTAQAQDAVQNRNAFFGTNPYHGEGWRAPTETQIHDMAGEGLREQYARAEAHSRDAQNALSIMDKLPSRAVDDEERFRYDPSLAERGIGENTRKFEGMTADEIRASREQARNTRTVLSHAMSVYDTPEGIRDRINDVQRAGDRPEATQPDFWTAMGPAGPDLAQRYAQATRDSGVLKATLDALRRNPTAFSDHEGRFQAHEFFGDNSVVHGHVANSIDGMTRPEMEAELKRREAERDHIRHQIVRYQEAYDGRDLYNGTNRYLNESPFEEPSVMNGVLSAAKDAVGISEKRSPRQYLDRDVDAYLSRNTYGIPVPARVRARIVEGIQNDVRYREGQPPDAALVREHADAAVSDLRRERVGSTGIDTEDQAEADQAHRQTITQAAEETLGNNPSFDQMHAIIRNEGVLPAVRAQATRQYVDKRVSDLLSSPERVAAMVKNASRLTKNEYRALASIDVKNNYDVHNNTLDELTAAEVLRRTGGNDADGFTNRLRDDVRVRDC